MCPFGEIVEPPKGFFLLAVVLIFGVIPLNIDGGMGARYGFFHS